MKTLKDFFSELNERNVEITAPTAGDRWGLRIITPDGKTQTFQELDATWQAAVKEVISYLRKNLDYSKFTKDAKPADLQFKSDGSVLIVPDNGTINFKGQDVPQLRYKLSSGIANKVASLMGGSNGQ